MHPVNKGAGALAPPLNLPLVTQALSKLKKQHKLQKITKYKSRKIKSVYYRVTVHNHSVRFGVLMFFSVFSTFQSVAICRCQHASHLKVYTATSLAL